MNAMLIELDSKPSTSRPGKGSSVSVGTVRRRGTLMLTAVREALVRRAGVSRLGDTGSALASGDAVVLDDGAVLERDAVSTLEAHATAVMKFELQAKKSG
jgi:hypothetical protein